MASLAGLIMKGLAPAAGSFERATRAPRATQERILLKYLARHRRTEYGAKYHFASIRSIDDFRERVPLCDYETIRPYIDRMKKGEAHILTRDPVVYFGLTSGTTGTPKLIPDTPYARSRKDRLMELWAYYAYRDHPRVLDGKVLGIISPEVKSHAPCGIPYGPEDGHAYNHLPEPVRRLYALPYEVFSIDDYDARYYCILRLAMAQDISTIATLNPSTLVLLAERIPALQDRIMDDIEQGTLDSTCSIPVDIRRSIEKHLKPDPRRARELRAMCRARKALLPCHIWPRLELIECWKGGAAAFYLAKLPPYYGDVAVRDFGCLSTEARSSVPMSDAGAGGVLAVQTNFYEFIPKEEMDSPRARTLLCDELETGREYLLIVTTAGGLYRYNIDDCIRVDGYFNRTPVIEFVQKGHNAVSITGEKVYESQVSAALTRASAKSALAPRAYCAAAAPDGPARYVILAEFDGTPSLVKMRSFLAAAEEELRIENSEYDDLRKQQLLAPSSLRVVRSGEFERYRRERVRQGAHDTQFKMPKLSADRAFPGRFLVEEEIFLA